MHCFSYLIKKSTKKCSCESSFACGNLWSEHAPHLKTCENWFRRFKSGDFDLTKSKENHQKSLKIPNCRHYWMKTIHKLKNNWLKHWMSIEQLSANVYTHWERSKKKENGNNSIVDTRLKTLLLNSNVSSSAFSSSFGKKQTRRFFFSLSLSFYHSKNILRIRNFRKLPGKRKSRRNKCTHRVRAWQFNSFNENHGLFITHTWL